MNSRLDVCAKFEEFPGGGPWDAVFARTGRTTWKHNSSSHDFRRHVGIKSFFSQEFKLSVHIAHLLCDCASTLNELPLGEAVSGAELQGASLLDQVDAAMAQLLHPGLYLEANLKA